MGEIILLRHGQTQWSKEGRHTGRTDVPLTAEGEARALTAGEALSGRKIAAAWTSPALRARRTAQLAGLSVQGTDPDLWEWDYGGYEGRTTAEIQAERPGWYLWDDGVVPGRPGAFPGETVEQVGERCDRVIARVRPLVQPDAPGAVDGDVVLVAHGHLLRVLAARWLGLPARAGAYFLLGTAALCALGFEHARPGISLWNQDTCA
ncbi:histidine phosphatase family protein [Actinocrinis puniceicyclus]|uniref:Histidine phosphatase family protein n=1 Tax=Actinocrinis puniceicyclus TaxID=977794 RepID=A0A8J8BEL2_9ACTN|nr:histidine phosphatase family protein [Actinocrinis puniceicyclus]MBS2965286.1 histidine phosphatase family protein [Actinocrinis puniceicyclus]